MTLKILVADDSVTIQKMISLAFSDEEAVVQPVSDGDSAIELLKSFRPDIVLADVCMPGCNGYEVCERIKDNPEFREIPVVLLAGTFEPYDDREAARVKSDGHLTKPFDMTELIDLVYSLAPKRGETDSPSLEKESAGQSEGDVYIHVPGGSGKNRVGRRSSVGQLVWDSFAGSDRILELFDAETLAAARGMSSAVPDTGNIPKNTETSAIKVDGSMAVSLSDELLDQIVDMVVRRMSTEVIRDVAWEVVPELSETLVRRAIEEQNHSS
jgi:CheY-like chemotaxis protein